MGNERNANRIDQTLADEAPGLWPFLAAGYPDLGSTAAMLRAMADLPIRGVELGFPFSDPIADGPVIQHAFSHALAGGVRVRQIFDIVASVRGDIGYPLLAMVSASIVYRIGTREFVASARAAGFDGLIVPDISLEEAPELARFADEAGLRLSMLIAPTTPPDREKRIAEVASGFLYYVSVQGTTGERGTLPSDLRDHVVELRDGTGLPVVVGFGISKPEHVRDVCGFADGVIVGSAIVRKITHLLESGHAPDVIVEHVTRLVAELASPER
ncbi:MAG: tryptophan synthase subunit alpha [Phycisphaerae bacterium]|nr:tryptophan synthase subunit alpha [Phycisphaerae bacterium]